MRGKAQVEASAPLGHEAHPFAQNPLVHALPSRLLFGVSIIRDSDCFTLAFLQNVRNRDGESQVAQKSCLHRSADPS